MAETLKGLTALFAEAVEKVTAANDQRLLDFMARRLVEMAGSLVMSYLMLLSAKTNESFTASATVYTKLTQALCESHIEFIRNFKVEQLAAYGI